MSTARLGARIEGARVLGIGHLLDHDLVFDKPGRDGTAKANVRPTHGGLVHGVVWQIEAELLSVLDRFEPGYERREIDIVVRAQGTVPAWLYAYTGEIHPAGPSRDYVRHLLEGAHEHGLPDGLVARLEAIQLTG